MENSPFIILPTIEEIRKWLLFTVQHVSQVEYFLHQLGIESDDPERPHDIVGTGNKFEWEPLRRYALQYRDEGKQFKKEIDEALAIHRKQYHHRMWNGGNLDATPESLMLGAIDAICALSEDRQYQGGRHTYEEITKIMLNNPPHKAFWMGTMLLEIKRIKQPDIAQVKSLSHILNFGISRETHDTICERVHETIIMLEQDYGYDAKKLAT